MANGPGQPPEPIHIADGFDAPVGIESERHSAALWPDSWYEDWSFGQPQVIHAITQYAPGVRLTQGYHDESDVPVYATASGIVTFSGEETIWGGVVVMRHDPLYRYDGMTVYTRYRYLRELHIAPGQRVARGQAIATVGDSLGFDVSTTDILASDPLHNPAESAATLYAHYSDPREFIAAHRPRSPQQHELLTPPA
ncbi:MAG: M23 family metallopeptidase, partial [Acidobacteriales bacterium]|nr:M23 family metallopeptidase [Terriglobales bacterium]